ncbi:MAG: AraC family transcriptional regulator [Clostridia bacterium]|nr:AraC family transcriptional regulator [Clostridia bacterium]
MVLYHLDNSHIENPLKFGDIYIHQAGTLYCGNETVINPHNHIKLFELTVVTDGEGEIVTNSESIRVCANDIHLSFPCDSHSIRSDFKKPLKYDFFSFSTDNEMLKGELEEIMQSNLPAKNRLFRDERINALVEDIILELNNSEAFQSGETVYSTAKLVLIRTIRAFKSENPQKAETRITNPKALCYTIKNYIDTHIYTMKNLSELSLFTGYNYSYLSTLYKKTMGETPVDYFTGLKIKTAKQLLKQDFTVSKVAELLNYSSVYAFSKAFRSKCNISPKEYKKAP